MSDYREQEGKRIYLATKCDQCGRVKRGYNSMLRTFFPQTHDICDICAYRPEITVEGSTD